MLAQPPPGGRRLSQVFVSSAEVVDEAVERDGEGVGDAAIINRVPRLEVDEYGAR